MSNRAALAKLGILGGFNFLVDPKSRLKTLGKAFVLCCRRGDKHMMFIAAARAEYAAGLQIVDSNQRTRIHAIEARLLIRFLNNHPFDIERQIAQRHAVADRQAKPVKGLARQPDMAGGWSLLRSVRRRKTVIADQQLPIERIVVSYRPDARQQELIVLNQYAGEIHGFGMAHGVEQFTLGRFREAGAFQYQVAAQGNSGTLTETIVYGVP